MSTNNEHEGRIATLNMLRYHVSPRFYHHLIQLSDAMLRAVITFYQQGGSEAEIVKILDEYAQKLRPSTVIEIRNPRNLNIHVETASIAEQLRDLGVEVEACKGVAVTPIRWGGLVKMKKRLFDIPKRTHYEAH